MDLLVLLLLISVESLAQKDKLALAEFSNKTTLQSISSSTSTSTTPAGADDAEPTTQDLIIQHERKDCENCLRAHRECKTLLECKICHIPCEIFEEDAIPTTKATITTTIGIETNECNICLHKNPKCESALKCEPCKTICKITDKDLQASLRAASRCKMCRDTRRCKRYAKCDRCKRYCDQNDGRVETTTTESVKRVETTTRKQIHRIESLVGPLSNQKARISSLTQRNRPEILHEVERDIHDSSDDVGAAAPVQENDDPILVFPAVSDAEDMKRALLSETAPRYYTIGAFRPGPRMNHFLHLLNVHKVEDIEKLIVIAKLKSNQPSSGNEAPVIIDYSKLIQNIDKQVEPGNRIDGPSIDLSSEIDRALQMAAEQKKISKGISSLTPDETFKVIQHAIFLHDNEENDQTSAVVQTPSIPVRAAEALIDENTTPSVTDPTIIGQTPPIPVRDLIRENFTESVEASELPATLPEEIHTAESMNVKLKSAVESKSRELENGFIEEILPSAKSNEFETSKGKGVVASTLVTETSSIIPLEINMMKKLEEAQRSLTSTFTEDNSEEPVISTTAGKEKQSSNRQEEVRSTEPIMGSRNKNTEALLGMEESESESGIMADLKKTLDDRKKALHKATIAGNQRSEGALDMMKEILEMHQDETTLKTKDIKHPQIIEATAAERSSKISEHEPVNDSDMMEELKKSVDDRKSALQDATIIGKQRIEDAVNKMEKILNTGFKNQEENVVGMEQEITSLKTKDIEDSQSVEISAVGSNSKSREHEPESEMIEELKSIDDRKKALVDATADGKQRIENSVDKMKEILNKGLENHKHDAVEMEEEVTTLKTKNIEDSQSVETSETDSNSKSTEYEPELESVEELNKTVDDHKKALHEATIVAKQKIEGALDKLKNVLQETKERDKENIVVMKQEITTEATTVAFEKQEKQSIVEKFTDIIADDLTGSDNLTQAKKEEVTEDISKLVKSTVNGASQKTSENADSMNRDLDEIESIVKSEAYTTTPKKIIPSKGSDTKKVVLIHKKDQEKVGDPFIIKAENFSAIGSTVTISNKSVTTAKPPRIVTQPDFAKTLIEGVTDVPGYVMNKMKDLIGKIPEHRFRIPGSKKAADSDAILEQPESQSLRLKTSQIQTKDGEKSDDLISGRHAAHIFTPKQPILGERQQKSDRIDLSYYTTSTTSPTAPWVFPEYEGTTLSIYHGRQSEDSETDDLQKNVWASNNKPRKSFEPLKVKEPIAGERQQKSDRTDLSFYTTSTTSPTAPWVFPEYEGTTLSTYHGRQNENLDDDLLKSLKKMKNLNGKVPEHPFRTPERTKTFENQIVGERQQKSDIDLNWYTTSTTSPTAPWVFPEYEGTTLSVYHGRQSDDSDATIIGHEFDWTSNNQLTDSFESLNTFAKIVPATDFSKVVPHKFSNNKMVKDAYFYGKMDLPLRMKYYPDGTIKLAVDKKKYCMCSDSKCNTENDVLPKQSDKEMIQMDEAQSAESKKDSTESFEDTVVGMSAPSIDNRYAEFDIETTHHVTEEPVGINRDKTSAPTDSLQMEITTSMYAENKNANTESMERPMENSQSVDEGRDEQTTVETIIQQRARHWDPYNLPHNIEPVNDTVEAKRNLQSKRESSYIKKIKERKNRLLTKMERRKSVFKRSPLFKMLGSQEEICSGGDCTVDSEITQMKRHLDNKIVQHRNGHMADLPPWMKDFTAN